MAYADKLGRLQDKSGVNYANVSSRAKKAHITNENILPIMLSQVPGVSVGIAEAIVAKYPTLQALLAAPKEELHTITIPTKTGKQRRISKPAARTRVNTSHKRTASSDATFVDECICIDYLFASTKTR